MALSTIVKTECPKCGKVAVETSRFNLGSARVIRLACGHIMSYQGAVEKNEAIYEDIVFSDGAKPRPYQIEAMKFAEEAGFRCIIADEQGLGKTIEALSLLRVHWERLLPAIITVPSTVNIQWMWEVQRICVPNNTQEEKMRFLTQVIKSGKEAALPGFQIYIITFDMLKKDQIFSFLPDDYIKTIIIDECQRIKNHLSDRAKAAQRMIKKCKHVIPMSGTPIKNNAGEYYTVLNAVAPTRFTHYQRYIDNYCDSYNNGWAQKIGGLKDPARFHEDTKDIIIRRTKDQVLKDLPSIERKFYHVELDPKLNKAYAKALQELDELFYSEGSAFERGAAIIAIYAKLRHITGISKVEECVDFTKEFLTSNDRKIVLFTHHTDVMEILKNNLTLWAQQNQQDPPLVLHSGLDSSARHALVTNFREGPTRVLIASTLAAGEGLNLQFCSDAVLLERQWNPANEEQTEARFHRFGQKNNVSVTYMIASGTIDEYFTELVETKRSIVAATMDNKEIPWDQQSLMAELSQILVTRGRERWRL